MSLAKETHRHLLAHHRNFDEFTKLMIDTYAARFDRVFWAFFEQYAQSAPARIVDLGTGPGLLLRDLHARYPKAEIIGVDAQPSMLEQATETIRSLSSVKLVAHDLAAGKIQELQTGSVDVAVCSMVLHEMQVPTVGLDEIARIVKPGGIAFIYDWVRQPLSVYFAGKRPSTLDEITHFSEHSRFTPEDLAWFFAQSGFSVREWIVRQSGKHALFALIRSS